MPRQIFVNLPVENLQKSIDFFTALGFSFNKDFTDESATCMIVEENIFVMLLVKKRFQDFTKKQIVDAKSATEVLIALSTKSKEEVDILFETALAHGATIAREAEDHGWMYIRSFADLDGHIWELCFMDEKTLSQNKA